MTLRLVLHSAAHEPGELLYCVNSMINIVLGITITIIIIIIIIIKQKLKAQIKSQIKRPKCAALTQTADKPKESTKQQCLQ